MAAYEIFFKASVWKELIKIPRAELKKILARIELLASDPRPPGSERLASQELHRIRQGNYRIGYAIQDAALTVWVIKVGDRKDVHR